MKNYPSLTVRPNDPDDARAVEAAKFANKALSGLRWWDIFHGLMLGEIVVEFQGKQDEDGKVVYTIRRTKGEVAK